MQVKGALKKARKVAMGSPSTARYLAYIALLLKLVAMGLLCTARYSAYIALPTNLANEEVARGLPDTARCQAYHCTTSSECARWEGNWLFVVVVDCQKVGPVSTKCTSCS